MAIIGVETDRQNPSYTIDDFCFWIPKMNNFMHTDDGARYFNKLYPMLDRKVYYSIFGTDWEYAISLAIAHYLTLIGEQLSRPSGSSLADATQGGSIQGVLNSVSVGGFSKSYDFNLTIKSGEDEALFWNQTSYGVSFYALMKTKAIASIFVVVNGNPYEGQPSQEKTHENKKHIF